MFIKSVLWPAKSGDFFSRFLDPSNSARNIYATKRFCKNDFVQISLARALGMRISVGSRHRQIFESRLSTAKLYWLCLVLVTLYLEFSSAVMCKTFYSDYRESDLANQGYYLIAQELVYQWLGSWITPYWWTDAHLNKAIAGFLAAATVNEVSYEVWRVVPSAPKKKVERFWIFLFCNGE